MGNYFGIVINIVFAMIAIVIICGLIFKMLRDRFSRERCLQATVAGKNTFSDRVVRFASHTRKRYVVTFDCNGRRKSFYVSELSYKDYCKGDKGTLRYKGSRLIDFS